MADQRVAAGSLYVANPVRVPAEHRYGIPNVVDVSQHDRKPDRPTARTSFEFEFEFDVA
ncbi:hypothetical protein [Antrihabitans stalagmiti]|uniref:hypothetical protein n=1 Tax=Antrihabitans stalagmiti TaxID=2799499 RepID=UPI001F1BDAB0|nr:hypothetical protein [Antrihabitans stalagmiti]